MAPRVTSPRLVDRTAELGTLDAALSRAGDGAPSLTLLAGEAGVGKTRLVRELCGRAEAAGAIVVRGTCVELNGGNLPYGPIAGMLRNLPNDAWAAALADLPDAARQALEDVRLGHAAQRSNGAANGATDRFAQSRLFEYLFTLLRRLSADATLVLVLEDFHWVDRSTRDFIVFLAPNLERERLTGIITYRTDEPVDGAMRHVLAELRRVPCVNSLNLPLFSPELVVEHLEAMLGRAPDPALAGELSRRSSGNPFFLEELLAASVDAGTAQLPETLAEALLDRLRRASPDAQQILRFAAVVGRPLDQTLFAEACPIAEPGLSLALRESIERQLLERSRDEETFQFHHAVVREAIYRDMLPGERAGLHAAVARALQRGPGPRSSAELAFHWRVAGNAGETLRASLDAGLDAERAHAFAEALRHFERALRLWDEAGSSDAFTLDRLDTLAHVADLAKFTGDYTRAEEACDDALRRIDPAEQPVRTARFYERKGRCQSFRDDSGLGCYRRALEVLPDRCRSDRARLLSAEALALINLQECEAAERRCQAALTEAAEAGARAEEMYARLMLGLAVGYLGDVDAGERHLRAALGAADALCHADDMLYGRLYLGEVLRLGGRVERALEVMLEGEQQSRRLGMHAAFGAYMTLNAGMDLMFLGHWQEAEERVATVSDRPPLAEWNVLLREQVAGELCVARGDWEPAERHLARAAALCRGGAPPEFAPAVFAALAELALWRHRLDEASAAISEGLDVVSDHTELLHAPVLFATGARVGADLAEANADLHARPPAPKALCHQLEQLLAARGESSAPPVGRAHLASCRAEGARAQGASAAALWREAAAAWRALHAPYPCAYASWREAEATLTAGGARGTAARTLHEAHATAIELGATPLRREIELLARRSRIDLAALPQAPVSRRQPGSEIAGLTARELEVLRLIADGLTNGQISERLYISPRTAGVHVSHILAKLNASNRASAAAAAHRMGLLRTAPD